VRMRAPPDFLPTANSRAVPRPENVFERT